MRRTARAVCRVLTPLLVGLAVLAGRAEAQNVISVPFTNGFIGTRGSSAGSANGVLTYATLGISRTFFIQTSSTNQFELQGNDIPGTLRIVRTNGTTLDIPASANWRMNSGSTTDLVGILPRPAAPITFAYAGGSIQITDGSNSGGTSIGGYVAGFAGATATNGSNQSGNAALSQLAFGSRGRGGVAYASAGAEVPVRRWLAARADVRRQVGSAPMSADYASVDRLDLGGTRLGVGLRVQPVARSRR